MKKSLLYILIIAGVTLFLASCQYKFNIEPVAPPPDPTDTISFSLDVLPIFTTNDNCTRCHNTGGTAPDLTPNNAYNEIINGYVDVNTPSNSKIYTVPNPNSQGHSNKYNTTEAAVVLQWIDQGALNN